MVIGICQVELHLPESHSLKDKRRIVKSIKDTIKHKFNVSISEIAHQNLWQRSGIGIVIICNDKKFANQVLSKTVNVINQNRQVSLIDYTTEFL